MKIFISACLASAGALLSLQAVAQTCETGSVDDRVAQYLKEAGPGPGAAALANISTADFRKQPVGNFPTLPADSVKRITVTTDNIKVNVVRARKAENLPVIINFHPGGFVAPLQPWMEYEALRLSKKFDAVVFDVDYRVAPENKFPRASNDAYAAYTWVVEHAKEYGGDPTKVILRGTDAGATLAALTAHRAKADGTNKSIKGMILICPFTDNPLISYYDSFESNAAGYGLTKELAQFYFQLYLDKNHWFANNAQVWPIHEKDFSGMPPTLIITTEFDVLRDEGIAYGKKLEQAGNAVSIKCFPHMIHNFTGLPAGAEESKRLNELTTELLSVALK